MKLTQKRLDEFSAYETVKKDKEEGENCLSKKP
jgi:hypothetical protein